MMLNMSWINFDWLKWHADQFGQRLDETILPIYRNAFKLFSDERDKHKTEAHAPDTPAAQLDEGELWSYLGWLDEEFRARRVALAMMIFALLAREIESFLDEFLRAVGREFPTDEKFGGKSKLLKRRAEYQARFGFDIQKGAGFDTVREIVLARNDAVHFESVPQKDYLAQTETRFLDEAGQLSLTPELLIQVSGELKVFVFWLAETLTDRVKRQRQASSPSSLKL
jgi:hypothetical protein